MKNIKQSVGNRGVNQRSDVLVIQKLLNRSIHLLIPLHPLREDGACGPITVGMIKEFQKRVMDMKNADGRVDRGKKTFSAIVDRAETKNRAAKPTGIFNATLLFAQLSKAKSSPEIQQPIGASASKGLTDSDYRRAAALIGVEVAAVKAVASIESSGSGFLSNGKPKILFEGHWFSKLTKGVYDVKHPTISYRVWTKKHYKGGSAEYHRYTAAASLDKEAAMKSTSWGKFQIMGFNHAKAGFGNVSQFVDAMHVSEGKQLEAFVHFLQSTKLDIPLKIKDWAAFARGYNGPAYAKNAYDKLLKQAYEAYSASPGAGINQ